MKVLRNRTCGANFSRRLVSLPHGPTAGSPVTAVVTRSFDANGTAGAQLQGRRRHYNVVNTDVNTSAIDDTADAMVVPLAAGISYRVERMVMDLRATYRPSFLDDISATQSAPLDSGSAAFNIGFEF